MRWQRASRDIAHAPIVKALTDAGRSVLDLSAVGGGCPDILVGWGLSHMVLMEIKTPQIARERGQRKLRKSQVDWHTAWKGVPVVVVRTVQEALEATGVVT